MPNDANPYVMINSGIKHRLVKTDNAYSIEIIPTGNNKSIIEDFLNKSGYANGIIPFDKYEEFIDANGGGGAYEQILMYYQNKENYNRHVEAANEEVKISTKVISLPNEPKPQTNAPASTEVINSSKKDNENETDSAKSKREPITKEPEKPQGESDVKPKPEQSTQAASTSQSDDSDNKIYYVTHNEIKETLSDDEDESNYAVVRGNTGYTSYLQNIVHY